MSTKKPRSPLFWPILGLILLVMLNVVLDLKNGEWKFLNISLLDGHLYGTPVDIFNQGSRVMLLALGMTLVIATGGVDLSVGSIMAVSGSVAAVLMAQHGQSLLVAVVASLAIGILAGFLNGQLVSRLSIQPIVATLILMVIGRGVAQLITHGDVVRVSDSGFEFLGNGFVFGIPFAPVLVIGIYAIMYGLLRRTAGGLFVEAVGDNETAARFAGLPAARVKLLVYIFCGLCAGIAGLLAASNIRAADPFKMGENLELDAIFAAVVGGTALTGGRFLIAGAFIGALLLQTLTTTMFIIGVPPQIAPVPKAVVILAVSLMQSEHARRWFAGMFGRKGGAA